MLIRLASRCPGPGSRCAMHRIAAYESLKTPTIFTPCSCNVSLFSIATSSASPITHGSASKMSIHPVPRKLRRDLHSFPCLHTAAAPTRPSSECDPSVHHIQTPAPILASFSLAQRCAALLAALVSSMVVLTTGSSPGAGQLMPSVVRPCSCSFLTTLHIGAPELGFGVAPLGCYCMRCLVSLQIAVVWSLRLLAPVYARTLSLVHPAGSWIWLVDRGGVGGCLACLLPWDPTKVHSHIVRPLGRTPLCRP